MLMMQRLVVEFHSYDSGGIPSRPLVVILDTLPMQRKYGWLLRRNILNMLRTLLGGQVFKLHQLIVLT